MAGVMLPSRLAPAGFKAQKRNKQASTKLSDLSIYSDNYTRDS